MIFKEETISSEMIYEGAILNLRKDKVTVVNGTSYREIIEHDGGAVIVALTEDNNVVMVRQYRKPSGKVLLEAPAGKKDEGESPEEVARRELKEETGYTASNLVSLGKMHTSPGYSEEVLYIFLATDLEKGETNFDEHEAIDIYEYPLEELVEMVMSNEIDDGKTQLAILKAHEYLRRRSDSHGI